MRAEETNRHNFDEAPEPTAEGKEKEPRDPPEDLPPDDPPPDDLTLGYF